MLALVRVRQVRLATSVQCQELVVWDGLLSFPRFTCTQVLCVYIRVFISLVTGANRSVTGAKFLRVHTSVVLAPWLFIRWITPRSFSEYVGMRSRTRPKAMDVRPLT